MLLEGICTSGQLLTLTFKENNSRSGMGVGHSPVDVARPQVLPACRGTERCSSKFWKILTAGLSVVMCLPVCLSPIKAFVN